ncbi:Adenylosuccinate lyase [bacterium HR36]|uniref:Adenylosuccinate lyase n=1 Tax=uncultured Planctomycetota bacterium TaxID=120965 RepID=H5SIH7_9BACT|nr:adenylosuccinate lyase [uncultured Planctomycetota bacterium]GBD35742.1 Adenylosuccinate lyase [bacterium HR36]
MSPNQPTIDNPLIERYASAEMVAIWSPQRRYGLWRRLWLALAEAQSELGLTAEDGKTPRISPRQLEAMRAHLDDIDWDRVAFYERRFRHDVMAHIYAFADVCPEARDIIHLGATSCYVTDNADLVLMRDAMKLLVQKLVGVIDKLAEFAERWRDLPALGYTHFQPAQLTTVGKRAILWCYDLVLDLEELEQRLNTLAFRGAKGTTGTQASFLELFRGDHEKVRLLDILVARKMGFERIFPATGQTYTRKVDVQVLHTLSGLGQSAHKFGTDLRLLQHERELEEPFEAEQVGSSAMAYKRNPMRAERLCSLARFLIELSHNAEYTAATQWLERTLDDSANRRLVLPQAFLTADAVLRLYLNIVSGLTVNPEVIAQHVARELPFMATEKLLMEAVRHGADRQTAHALIRRHSLAAAEQIKLGRPNDLLERLVKEPVFAELDFAVATDPRRFVGRAPEQVTEFLHDVIAPIRQRYHAFLGQHAEISV